LCDVAIINIIAIQVEICDGFWSVFLCVNTVLPCGLRS